MSKRAAAAVVLPAVLATLLPVRAAAAPDPTIAALLSTGSTVLPIAATTGLWTSGRGADEGLRFDLGLVFLATGAIAGPSIGQIYGSGGSDAVVTFILRMLTGTLMTVGTGLWVRSDNTKDAGRALAILGGIPTVFLAGWDIFGAAESARESTRRERMVADLGLTPDLLSVLACGPIPCVIDLAR
ncbi:hypothetical protein L6R52_37260 [Myxococcota bacterium]|nr:hypothetical protein [Myxococcota bacterium]